MSGPGPQEDPAVGDVGTSRGPDEWTRGNSGVDSYWAVELGLGGEEFCWTVC